MFKMAEEKHSFKADTISGCEACNFATSIIPPIFKKTEETCLFSPPIWGLEIDHSNNYGKEWYDEEESCS